ncbi:hypothetical protein [Paenibacillus apiarius]|uniref:hypothetical protein n=1 Tax=Paenibacillus apiarius TaxID=46240 RepID=UPI001981875F|nr:hypothetical protein [Paenibacillus apiarius]MBN3523892.1 hypothetical protein [Paenibacillus apiarius]
MRKGKTLAAFLALAVVLGQTGYLAEAAPAAKQTASKPAATKQAQPAVHTLDKLSPVKLTGKSFVKLTDLNILTQDDGNVLTYTLTYYNNDTKSISLLDYWTKVKSKSGTIYSVNMISKDKDKKNIAPQSQMNVTYYAKLGKNVKVNDLFFQIIKWDFSKPGFENQIGHFSIPASYSITTPTNQARKIRINDIPLNSKVEQMLMFPSDGYNMVNLNVSLENIGYKVLEDPKLKFSIRANNGANYPLALDSSSVDYKIQPKDKKTLNLMTKIPTSVKLDKLELQIIQEDVSAKSETDKINYAVATLQLPMANSKDLVTQQYKEKIIKVENTKLETRIQTGWITQSYDNSDVSLTFEIKNIGNQPITLPKYEFTIHADKGEIFPISNKMFEKVTLQPAESKSFKLNATIPTASGTGHLKLHMNTPSENGTSPAEGTNQSNKNDNQYSFPVAVYEVPELISIQNAKGSEFQVANSKGTFGVTLSSIQRLPWTDGDIVSAKLTLRNKEFKTLELPKLEGMFKIDSAKSTGETKLIQSDSSLVIGPKSEMDVYIVTKVPSYLDFTQLQIALMEKLGEETSELIQFTNSSKIEDLDVVKFGSDYNLKTAGRKAEIKARETLIYPGTSSNLVVTDLEMKNAEKRPTDLSQIVGYYKSKDGELFKANIIQVDHQTGPEGKNIVTLWARIPDKVYTTDMQLIIGEGITDGKLTPPKGEANGYVNAVALELQTYQPGSKTPIEKIEMFPYTLTMNKLKAEASGASLRLEFNYHLDRDLSYDMGEYQHKLVFEVTDTSGRAFSKEVALESELKVGLNQTQTISFDSSFFDNVKSGNVMLSIYDQFQGHKLRLAHQALSFYSKDINNSRD